MAGTLLIGSTVGLLTGVARTGLIHQKIRPDVVIALVCIIPSVTGMPLILFSGRRWVAILGSFILAVAPD
ncbi:putative holin [Mycobacterium lepromatosis]|uniref:putative holin n=1 Tax=Mycobacterium lepromatosis TaxID=480418 RepID=UPI0015846113|nr:putative holin [Mycobacterium lepromatosis]